MAGTNTNNEMNSLNQYYARLKRFEDSVKAELRARDMISRIICGGISGIVAKTAIAPVERVKMSYQVSREPFSFRGALLKGLGIVQKNGFFALWRGHSTTILRVAPYAGFSYAIHDFAENEFKKLLNTNQLPMMYKFMSGSIGGIGGTLLTYPLDVLRVRLALIPGTSWSVEIARGGLFQGITPTLIGVIPYSGMFWMTKQVLLEYYHIQFPNKKKPAVIESLTINTLAGVVGQLCTYPLDIVRRRLQMFDPKAPEPITTVKDASKAVLSGSKRKAPSFIQELKHLFETEGFKGFTKGFSLNIMKGPITLSLSLTTYDTLRHWIDSKEESHL